MEKKINYAEFKPEQIEAARLLATREVDTDQKLTYDEIAKKVGVNRRTLLRWREDEKFIALVEDIADKYMAMFLTEVYGHLRKQVRRGSVKAIELALKRAGKLIDRKEVSSDMKVEVKGLEGKTNEELKAETEALEKELLAGDDDA